MTVVNQRKLLDRISELVDDGYLDRGKAPNTILITQKGLLALLATADRPINKSKLAKESLNFERENAQKKATKI